MTADQYISADTPNGTIMLIVILLVLGTGLVWLWWWERRPRSRRPRHRATHRGHRITDPVCTQYYEPRNWLERWWWNRGRGRSCEYCMRQRVRWNAAATIRDPSARLDPKDFLP